MDLAGVYLTLTLFIAYLPYKIILKKFKIPIEIDKDSKKIWLVKGIIYWSNFFIVGFILKKVFNI